MSKSTILKLEKDKFDLRKCLEEIRVNLGDVKDTAFIPMYMRPSRIEENIFVENECLEAKNIDTLNNDDILYVSFVLDKALCCEDGFICGEGSEFDSEEIKYGDFIQDDSGFIIEFEEGMIHIRKATYGPINPIQAVAKIVDDAGEFENIIDKFIKKFIKK